MAGNPVIAFIRNPYFLLSFAILCWGGNFVVARWANLDAPPIALSFWRHAFSVLLVVPFIIPVLRTDWPVMRTRMGSFVAIGGLLAAGNTLVYYAVIKTTVVNAALINAGVPVAVVFFSWLVLRDTINRWQAIGILFAFIGIVVVVTKAQLGILIGLEFGWGDVFMLGAIVCWALYMVLLKRAQLKISGLSLLAVLSATSTLWLVPAYGVELALGYTMTWSALTFASLAYVVVFSTILAWICWNSGTLQIGPNRASAFMCLHPVFGSALGMIFFDETLRPYHAVGTALVLAGVVIVSRVYRKPA